MKLLSLSLFLLKYDVFISLFSFFFQYFSKHIDGMRYPYSTFPYSTSYFFLVLIRSITEIWMWHKGFFCPFISRNFLLVLLKVFKRKEKAKKNRTKWSRHLPMQDTSTKRLWTMAMQRSMVKKGEMGEKTSLFWPYLLTVVDLVGPFKRSFPPFFLFLWISPAFLLYSSPGGSECNLIARIRSRPYIYILIGFSHGIWMNANPVLFSPSTKSRRA